MPTESRRRHGDQCPYCGSADVKRIIYGYPGEFDYWRADEVPGGCLVSGNDPKWCCGDCQKAWGRPDPWPDEIDAPA